MGTGDLAYFQPTTSGTNCGYRDIASNVTSGYSVIGASTFTSSDIDDPLLFDSSTGDLGFSADWRWRGGR